MLLFFFCAAAAGGQTLAVSDELAASISRNHDRLRLSVDFFGYDRDEFLTNVNEGLKPQITFQIKVYRKAEGFFKFLGDRLVEEYHPMFEAGKDPFLSRYVIYEDSDKKTLYTDPALFLKSFFRLRDYPIPQPETEPLDGHYILVQVVYKKIRLLPPLNILSLVFMDQAEKSEWYRVEVDEE